jgi:hypothetical protein
MESFNQCFRPIHSGAVTQDVECINENVVEVRGRHEGVVDFCAEGIAETIDLSRRPKIGTIRHIR